MAFSGLISVYMSPLTGGATGVPRTTAPSGVVSIAVCSDCSSLYTYLPASLCMFVAAATAAAWLAAFVVSAAARSSATRRSSSSTPPRKPP
uniref:Uncharacterized protein n=1 Tax=Arundo donax TaxID=35708 RepID=A0A0A9E789_ARUDO